MQLVLLGAPGAGKGTQAKLIVEKYHLLHLSTGDVLRKNIADGTPLGMKAAPYMESGKYVPDELIIDMVSDQLQRPHARHGVIFDGYPRTLVQAQSLDELLDCLKCPLDLAIHLEINSDELVARLSGRRVCTGCGAVYHLKSMPPIKAGKCDLCGSPLMQRPDDTEETLRTRLAVYHQQTEPLLDYYQAQRKLRSVDAAQGVEKTFERISMLLGG